jgi:hypothetical protein
MIRVGQTLMFAALDLGSSRRFHKPRLNCISL